MLSRGRGQVIAMVFLVLLIKHRPLKFFQELEKFSKLLIWVNRHYDFVHRTLKPVIYAIQV